MPIDNKTLLGAVKFAADMRGDPELPDSCIEEAIRLAENDEVKIERYPTGIPSAKSLYSVASRLYAASNS